MIIVVIRLFCYTLVSMAFGLMVSIIFNALFELISLVLTTNWLPEEDEEGEVGYLDMEFDELLIFLMPNLVHHQPDDLPPDMEFQFLLPAPAG